MTLPAVTPAEGVLIVNADWIDLAPFSHFEILRVPDAEPWGANTLALNGTVLVTGSSPQTADLLESKGLRVRRLDISELQKAEAALTCLSGLLHKYAHVRGEAFLAQARRTRRAYPLRV